MRTLVTVHGAVPGRVRDVELNLGETSISLLSSTETMVLTGKSSFTPSHMPFALGPLQTTNKPLNIAESILVLQRPIPSSAIAIRSVIVRPRCEMGWWTSNKTSL